MQIHGHEIVLTKQEKLFFPNSGITKGDLVRYYQDIAEHMLPYLKDRPLTLQRFPDGIGQEGFFQKNASEYFPKWVKTIKVEKEGGWVNHVLCDDLETLIYLVNQNATTFHVWLSTAHKLHHPDKIVFDLDPPDENFPLVVKGAKALKYFLEKELGFTTYLMTTGSRGLHVMVPLTCMEDFDEVHNFAKLVANYICMKNPKDFTTTIKKDQRMGRLFIDYLRNSYAQTVVAPFSVRPFEKAPVASPISWDLLKGQVLHSQTYNVNSILKKIENGKNPWADFESQAKSITGPKKTLENLTGKIKDKTE